MRSALLPCGLLLLSLSGCTAGGGPAPEDAGPADLVIPACTTDKECGGALQCQAGRCVPITMQGDTTAPKFAGATSALPVDPASIKLTWVAATDDRSPPAKITYEVYLSEAAGAQNFLGAPWDKITGAAEYTAPGLKAAQQYYAVVRALDEAKNSDSNTVEVSATTKP
ncbi:MAG: fibronectin type III domain-containing protein [Myxococcales bacterium]|nr:fibronectin type III domain-containing protein [Myxococcales bacterium]